MTGEKCDSCLPNHYGFSEFGCKKCDCDPLGSSNLQCNERGQCECNDRVSGDKCDKCTENFNNFTTGCQRCDECYNLVQTSVNYLRSNISLLNSELDRKAVDVASRVSEVTALETKVRNLKSGVSRLHGTLYKPNTPQTFNETLVELRKSVEALSKDLAKNEKKLAQFEDRLTKDLNPLADKFRSTFGQVTLQLTVLQVMQSQQSGNIDALTEEFNKEFASIQAKYPNLGKMRDLAGEARKEAQRQQKLAKEYEDKVTSHSRDAKEAFQVTQDMLAKIIKMAGEGMKNNLEYTQLMKQAKEMVEQSRLLKKKMDEQVREAKQVNAELSKFKMPSYDVEIQRANDRIDDINTIVRKS